MATTWRLIYNPEAHISDIPAVPAALAAGRLAGRFLPRCFSQPDTLVIQHIRGKGILAGAVVAVDAREAAQNGISLAAAPSATGRRAPRLPWHDRALRIPSGPQALRRKNFEDVAVIEYARDTGTPCAAPLT